MSDTSTPPNPEQPSPGGVPPVENPPPPVPEEPPYAPAKEARQTHVAMTQEQEQEAEQKAELAKTKSHQSTLAQANGPKETRSGSDELAAQSSASTSSSHGRDSVSDNKTKRS